MKTIIFRINPSSLLTAQKGFAQVQFGQVKKIGLLQNGFAHQPNTQIVGIGVVDSLAVAASSFYRQFPDFAAIQDWTFFYESI